ncbi:MAG: hypothetical protein NC517_11290 [Firmicutes bacterium]|nr:hypothetical protein [Bacillota bacterium]
MEEKGTSPVTAFDSLFTTNKIQMLKVLLAWIPSSQQGIFAVYIKFLELQHTLTLLQRPGILYANSRRLSTDFFSGDNSDTIELLDELLPYSSQIDRTRIDNMKNMLQNMGRLKEMMEMAEMMKELFPDGFGGENPMGMPSADGMSPMDILSGMAGMSGADISAAFGSDSS